MFAPLFACLIARLLFNLLARLSVYLLFVCLVCLFVWLGCLFVCARFVVCVLVFALGLVCSTRLPGGNQVDGVPLAPATNCVYVSNFGLDEYELQVTQQ